MARKPEPRSPVQVQVVEKCFIQNARRYVGETFVWDNPPAELPACVVEYRAPRNADGSEAPIEAAGDIVDPLS